MKIKEILKLTIIIFEENIVMSVFLVRWQDRAHWMKGSWGSTAACIG